MGSQSFDRLLELSWFVSMGDHKTETERVALYIHLMHKERAVALVPGLEDNEWRIIQREMNRYAFSGGPIAELTGWRAERMDWVRALDTLREFERE